MLFEVTLLRSFQAVAQEASFTKAAERLNSTQSAVSSHVRRLEEQAAKSHCGSYERDRARGPSATNSQ
jgi:DNA-binding Lrp family transcriptional regulator